MFHVGQKVVCVDDTPRDEWTHFGGPPSRHTLDGLTKGVVYTVHSLYVAPIGSDCLRVEEITRPVEHDGNGGGFRTCRFRPVVTDRIAIFRAMLTPVPERETV